MNSINFKSINKYAQLISLLLISFISYGDTFCVANDVELINALDVADSNNVSDHIKLRSATFFSPSGGFIYNGTNEAHDIEISGGWTPNGVGSGDCTFFDYTTSSSINGLGLNSGLSIIANSSTNISIRHVTFKNGDLGLNGVNSLGGGLMIENNSLLEETILIEGCTFVNNTAVDGAALLIFGQNDSVVVRNNLFTGNTAGTGGTINISQNNGDGVFFINNTVINNDGEEPASGMIISSTNLAKSFIINNVLWANQVADLQLLGNGIKHLYNNDITLMVDYVGTLISSGNISLSPMYLLGGYLPMKDSPLFNSGRHPLIAETWQLSNFDIRGRNRILHGRVDIGAFERQLPDLIFADDFE